MVSKTKICLDCANVVNCIMMEALKRLVGIPNLSYSDSVYISIILDTDLGLGKKHAYMITLSRGSKCNKCNLSECATKVHVNVAIHRKALLNQAIH